MTPTKQGAQAYKEGKHYTDNPYHGISRLKADEWLKGYRSAEQLAKIRSGLNG